MLNNIIEELTKHKDTYFVGGCLRDAVLKRDIYDIDIVTAAVPRRLATVLAKKLQGAVFPLKWEKSIYRVKAGNWQIDVTRMKGHDITSDLAKRDFMINAMALPVSYGETFFLDQAGQKKLDLSPNVLNRGLMHSGMTELIDPYGGKDDIKREVVRMLTPRVYDDDPLRLLRTYRIAAQLGFTIDRDTRDKIKKKYSLITNAACERIREELLKLFSVPDSFGYLRLMVRDGILYEIIPETLAMQQTAHEYYGKMGVLGHVLKAVNAFEYITANLKRFFPDTWRYVEKDLAREIGGFNWAAMLKMAVLMHDIGKPATAKMREGRLRFFMHDSEGEKICRKILTRLRYSSNEINKIGKFVLWHMRPGNLALQPVVTSRAIYRFFRDLDGEGMGMLLVALSDHWTYLTKKERDSMKDRVLLLARKLLAQYYLNKERISPSKIIDGNLIMKTFGLPEGQKIGKMLAVVTEAQAEGKVKTKKDAVEYIARRFRLEARSQRT